MDRVLEVVIHPLSRELKMASNFAIILVLILSSFIGMDLVWLIVNIPSLREQQIIIYIVIFLAPLELISFIGMEPAHHNVLILWKRE